MAMVSDETQDAASEDDFSDLEELFNNKLNINDLSDDDFSVFFFLTDFEQASLAYYVAHNRPLLSMYELQFVLGLPLQKQLDFLPWMLTYLVLLHHLLIIQ